MCAAVVEETVENTKTLLETLLETARIQRERERSASHLFLPAAGNVINRGS